jgi:hypothetical protein
MKYIVLFVCIMICISGCKKHSDTQTSSQVHVFKGIDVINDAGTILGTWGTEDGDWGTDANWTTDEYELLNFPDTLSLDGTYIEDTTGWNIGPGTHEQPKNMVIVYPNPVLNQAMLVCKGFGNLKVKAVIVDKYYNRLTTFAYKWTGLVESLLNFSDSIKFKNGVYRMFYSFSTKDSINFYKGHGDILICREQSWQDCKSLVP